MNGTSGDCSGPTPGPTATTAAARSSPRCWRWPRTAAAGTWIAWRTATDLPSDRELRTLNATLTGIPADAPLYHETSAQQGPSVAILADGTADWSAARIRDSLTGAGWRLTSYRESETTSRPAPREDVDISIPTTSGSWTATSDGLKMHGEGWVMTGSPYTGLASYTIRVWPAEPVVLRPLTIAGLVTGLLAGWLLVAGLAGRRPATGLATAGLAAATVPAYRFCREAYEVLAYAHGSPDPSIVDGSHSGTLTLICAVAGLSAVVAAVLVRP